MLSQWLAPARCHLTVSWPFITWALGGIYSVHAHAYEPFYQYQYEVVPQTLENFIREAKIGAVTYSYHKRSRNCTLSNGGHQQARTDIAGSGE